MHLLKKKTDYNSKTTEAESKIPDVSNLVKKRQLNPPPKKKQNTDYNAKITEIESKYITTTDYNKFTKDNVDNSIKSKNLVTKTDFDAKLQNISKRINKSSNKSKHLLVENELKKLQKFDLSYFRARNRFEEDGVQDYLVFQPMYKYFKKIGSTKSILSWESKGLSDEVIKPPNNSLAPTVKYAGKRM